MASPFVLAVAIDGPGAHPAAGLDGRDPRAPGTVADLVARAATRTPGALATAAHWERAARTVDRDGIAFVTIADGPAAARADGPAAVPWLDALVIACRIGPVTERVGIVAQIPTVTTDPLFVSTQIATLDWVTGGRAGWEPRVDLGPEVGGYVGPRPVPAPGERHADAAEHIDVVRRLWDSWEDDAVIRDARTNRFVDRERLHHIDYEGRHLSVKGPSITPRPPQGQPLVTIAVTDERSLELAARCADVAFVDEDPGPLRAAAAAAGRGQGVPIVLSELDVLLDEDLNAARARAARLDLLAATPGGRPRFVGTPEQLTEHLRTHAAADGVDGVRVHPCVVADDLEPVAGALVAALRAGGALAAGATTLRERLGLARPANRYVPAA